MNCTIGKHILVELSGCPEELLNDSRHIESVFTEAVNLAGAHIINKTVHNFEPQGVSVVFVLSESHLSIHSWPEKGYAAIDMYTCGTCNTEKACYFIAQELQARNHYLTIVDRGIPSRTGTYYHEIKERS